MKKLLLFLCAIPFIASAQDCQDLFFSEYVEGSENSKCLEIYNPTDQIIDLGQYWVARYSNGSTKYEAGGITQLEGFILPYSTFILVNGQTTEEPLPGGGTSGPCDPALQAIAKSIHGMFDGPYPSPTYMNGNDAIALLKDTVDNGSSLEFKAIDLFGAIADGMQPLDEGWASFTQDWAYMNIYEDDILVGRDSTWISKYIVPDGYYWLPWTADHSLFRKKEIMHGVTALPDSFNVRLEWDTVPGGKDAWDYLNYHVCDCKTGSGVNTISHLSDIYVYPNPVAGSFINLYTTEPIEWIELLSITGRILYYRPLSGIAGSTAIPVEDYPPGIYFVRAFASDKHTLVKKLIIQ